MDTTRTFADRAARWSLIAPIAMVLINYFARTVSANAKDPNVTYYMLVGAVVTNGLALLAGLVLGVIGLRGGARLRKGKTIGFAAIGLIVNLGVLGGLLYTFTGLAGPAWNEVPYASLGIKVDMPNFTVRGEYPVVGPNGKINEVAATAWYRKTQYRFGVWPLAKGTLDPTKPDTVKPAVEWLQKNVSPLVAGGKLTGEANINDPKQVFKGVEWRFDLALPGVPTHRIIQRVFAFEDALVVLTARITDPVAYDASPEEQAMVKRFFDSLAKK